MSVNHTYTLVKLYLLTEAKVIQQKKASVIVFLYMEKKTREVGK